MLLGFTIEAQNGHIVKMSGYTTKRNIFYMSFLAFVCSLFPVTLGSVAILQVNAQDTTSKETLRRDKYKELSKSQGGPF